MHAFVKKLKHAKDHLEGDHKGEDAGDHGKTADKSQPTTAISTSPIATPPEADTKVDHKPKATPSQPAKAKPTKPKADNPSPANNPVKTDASSPTSKQKADKAEPAVPTKDKKAGKAGPVAAAPAGKSKAAAPVVTDASKNEAKNQKEAARVPSKPSMPNTSADTPAVKGSDPPASPNKVSTKTAAPVVSKTKSDSSKRASNNFFDKLKHFNVKTALSSGDSPAPDKPLPCPKGPLGNNVIFFTPADGDDTIQEQVDIIYNAQKSSEFGSNRYAIFFSPGKYKLDVKVGYYTTVHGLGKSPEDVVIEGAVRSIAALEDGNATTTFWRGVENLTVIPTIADDDLKLQWATSQGTWLRRVNVKGDVILSDHGGWCSGGYISDSCVSGDIDSSSQQQYFIRNTKMGTFTNGAYAQVFVGCPGAPEENWPEQPYSNTKCTPVIREKPYFVIEEVDCDDDAVAAAGNDDAKKKAVASQTPDATQLAIVLPGLRQSSQGPSWSCGGNSNDVYAALDTWYVVEAETFNIDTVQNRLSIGINVLFTPGVYNLTSALKVTRANTAILGIGLATLKTLNGTPALTIDDIDGVTVSGLLLDAGENHSSSLMRIGDAKSTTRHKDNPIVINDILFRVSGVDAAGARCNNMLTVNVRDTVIDHIWCWRADHDQGVGWNLNQCNNGLLVEADDVTAYALFVEHCNEFQTVWNGENGKVYFYQVSKIQKTPQRICQYNPFFTLADAISCLCVHTITV